MTTEFGGTKYPSTAKKTNRAAHAAATVKIRREDAIARDTAFGRLSPREQIASLDARLGKGAGAIKQRARIAARLAPNRKSPAGEASPTPEDAR